jgi:L-amino acid N-acyltransferase YncA
MSKKISFRKTKAADIKELACIYTQVYEAECYKEKWDYTQSKKLLDFYFKLETFIGFTSLCDGKVCGAFFSYIKPWWDGKHLAEGEIFIDPKFQNKHIGTDLYFTMMKYAYKKGCRVHELVAYKKPASWYKKIGFKETKLIHLFASIKDVISRMEK